jgi:hypothetical protein
VSVDYSIDEHQVRLGAGLRIVVDHPDCVVAELDLATKRPEILPGSDGNGDAVVHLYAGTETLRAADDPAPTVVRFPGRGDWHMIVDGGRYTVRICLYRWPNEPEPNPSDPEERTHP